MKRSRTLLRLNLIALLTVCSSSGILAAPGHSTTNNPYAEIPEKNVFKLRRDEHIYRHEEPPKPPNNIKLTGFMQHATQGTRVLLAEVPKDPKQPLKLFNLGVGQQEDGVEVVRIHPGQDAVDVVIDGLPETLTVKSNSFVTALIPGAVLPKQHR